MSAPLYELFSHFSVEYTYVPLPEEKRTDTLKGILHDVEINTDKMTTLVKADFSYNGDHWDLYRQRTGSIDRRIFPNPATTGLKELSVFSKLRHDQATIYLGSKPQSGEVGFLPLYVRRIGLGLVVASYYLRTLENLRDAQGVVEVTRQDLDQRVGQIIVKQLMY